ncbi:hypothetical protein BKA63DRAFT_497610 [Paraphoma chrysanthemicola]|nr:hypothetical protein BKA63DRAFT_497610 [Paraphoma chrysanthemicola]
MAEPKGPSTHVDAISPASLIGGEEMKPKTPVSPNLSASPTPQPKQGIFRLPPRGERLKRARAAGTAFISVLALAWTIIGVIWTGESLQLQRDALSLQKNALTIQMLSLCMDFWSNPDVLNFDVLCTQAFAAESLPRIYSSHITPLPSITTTYSGPKTSLPPTTGTGSEAGSTLLTSGSPAMSAPSPGVVPSVSPAPVVKGEDPDPKRYAKKAKAAVGVSIRCAVPVRAMAVPPQKIERWMKRNEVVESFLYAPSPAACKSGREKSPQMPSPALSSVSSIVRPQGSVFAGQSPALAYRSLPNLRSGSIHTSSAFESQIDVDARPRYTQDKEERLREHIFRAETSIGYSSSESSDKLYDLGVLLIAQGRYKTAEEVIRRLVESHESQSGDGDGDGVDKLKALDLLGQVLGRQGLYIKAERLCRQSLKRYERVLGLEHPHTLTSIYHLAFLFHRQRYYPAALELYQRAYSGYVKALGAQHPTTVTCFNHYESAAKYIEI